MTDKTRCPSPRAFIPLGVPAIGPRVATLDQQRALVSVYEAARRFVLTLDAEGACDTDDLEAAVEAVNG